MVRGVGTMGFAVVARKSREAAEVLWLAVAAAHLAGDGVGVVAAKTLDGSSGYRPYEATRAFWERNGFVQIDTIDPLPGRRPGNPAAIYVTAVRPTR